MSIIKAFREESEVIKFDNLFTRDLEDEQQFDLVFAAEQDDEDLKTIAGNKIMRENGEEKVFDLPDCIYVNEDGEVKDKDDEVEDISSNDADDDGVDDDIEAAEVNPTAAAPSVVVNVDADDVNINAGNGGTSFEGSDEEVKEDASVTVNAKVVNMTTNVDPGNKEDEVPAPSTEPAAAPVPAEAPSDDEPIEPVGDVEVDVETEPSEPESSEADVEECGDNCGSTPGTDDNGVPMGEGVEQIMTPSQLEDVLNNGLGVAPAYEGGQFINIPEDKSTEVVFSNSNDKEVREAKEPTSDPSADILTEAEFSFWPKFKKSPELKKYQRLAGECQTELNKLGENVETLAQAEKAVSLIGRFISLFDNIASIAALPICLTIVGIPVYLFVRVIVFAEESINEAIAADAYKRSHTQLINIANKQTDKKKKEEILKAAEKIDKEYEKFKKKMESKNEAAEPTSDPSVKPVKEEIEAVKNDDNLENSKKIEGEFEDDLDLITDADVEKLLNTAPEDEVKKEVGQDTVKPADVPMNDGSAHEAAEPTSDPPADVIKEAKEPTTDPAIELIKEEDIDICCDPTEGVPPCADCQGKAAPVPAPSKDSSDYNPYGKDPIEDKEDGMRTIDDLDMDIQRFDEAESMDPKEDIVQADAETSLEGIGPGLTSGNLEKMYVDKDVDPNRKNSARIEESTIDPIGDIEDILEAKEPTTDPAIDSVKEFSLDPMDYVKEFMEAKEPTTDPAIDVVKEEEDGKEADKEVVTSSDDSGNNNEPQNEAKEPTSDPSIGPVKEEIEAVKNDDNLENAKKIEGDFEDDLDPITDGDMEKILNAAPEDETKKEVGQDPVKPSDVPMNDGSAHEAAEPTSDPPADVIKEAKEPTSDPPIEFIKEEDTEILSSDDIDMDNNCDISPVGPTKVIPDEVNAPKEDIDYDKEAAPMREADFMDQVNALDNGDNFADTMNTGINIAPEEIIPGSDEELIDDEAIAFIEGE